LYISLSLLLMVLLFYLLGSFGTYVCSFGKVAENV